GLAAAAFVRAFSTVFLGRARSVPAEHALEPPASMQVPLVALAFACATIGLAPTLVAPLLDRALAVCRHDGGQPLAALVPFGTLAQVSLGCTLVLAAGLWRIMALRRRRAERLPAVGTWDCGYVDAASPRLQYTGSSFAQAGTGILAWTARERAAAPGPL